MVDDESDADGGVSLRVDKNSGSDEEASITCVKGSEGGASDEEEEHRSRSSGSSRDPSPE